MPQAAVAISSDQLDVDEISDAEQLQALEPEWSALFGRCPRASPFQSPEWMLPWRRTFLSEGLWTLAVRRSGRLVGIAPMFIYRDPADGSRQLTLLGNGITDRLDLLAEPEAENEAAQAVFDRLAARAELWDRCDFRDLPGDSKFLIAPLPLPVREQVEPEDPCPVVTLPDEPERVLERLSRSRRTDLRRCARRAAEAGRLDFETADKSALDEGLTALVEMHGARWRARGEAGVFADPAVVAFHRSAAAGLLARGWLRLNLLRLDGRIIAAQYALIRGDRGYSYIHSFDPALAGYGPGWLLAAYTLEQAVRTGARTFDFLRGREPYKYDWRAADQPQFRRRIWR